MTLNKEQLPKGYMERVLHVDLTKEEYNIQSLEPKLAQLFLEVEV